MARLMLFAVRDDRSKRERENTKTRNLRQSPACGFQSL